MHIRKAKAEDLTRIAEMEVFNYRLNFYPIFRSDWFYFEELQVPKAARKYENALESLWVYDDGVVKGFMQVVDSEIKKLFVEPALQGRSIGGKLLDHAVAVLEARFLWALEKNEKAIAFYERHGFRPTGDRKYEEDTTEFLIRLER
ncbi:MAG: GNAT family N-acetyltransferase [Oscillospiraceae bacterium]|nr:GNAT family N-acetyltransferase [Oscillospiraceae bacterium]